MTDTAVINEDRDIRMSGSLLRSQPHIPDKITRGRCSLPLASSPQLLSPVNRAQKLLPTVGRTVPGLRRPQTCLLYNKGRILYFYNILDIRCKSVSGFKYYFLCLLSFMTLLWITECHTSHIIYCTLTESIINSKTYSLITSCIIMGKIILTVFPKTGLVWAVSLSLYLGNRGDSVHPILLK